MQRVTLVSQNKKRCICDDRYHQVYKSPYLFRVFFHVLCDKLDKLARQCQAVNSHLQICENCTIDCYIGTNQVLMSDNPESQRFLEIFLYEIEQIFHCYYKFNRLLFHLLCYTGLYSYTTKCIKKNIFSSKKFLCWNFFEIFDSRSADTIDRLGCHMIVLCQILRCERLFVKHDIVLVA